MRMTVLAIVLILAAFDPSAIFDDGCSWMAKAVLHNFFHANIFHLAANMFVFLILYGEGRPHRFSLFAASFVIGTISYAAAMTPALGLSDMVYATIGLLAPPFKDRWWRKPVTAFFLLLTVAGLAVPHISATTHISAFVLGVLSSRIRDIVIGVRNDVKRTAGYH